MAVSTPGSTPGEADDRRRMTSPSPVPSHRLSDLREFFFPAGESNLAHIVIVAVVLTLDAALVLVVSLSDGGALTRGPAVYLVLPAAAAVYLSLAAVFSALSNEYPGARTRTLVAAVVSLLWAAGLVTLVAVSGEAGRSLAGVSRSAWLYPACLAGVSLPLVSFWLNGPTDLRLRQRGVVAAILPPLIALTVVPPGFGSGVLVILTSTTLLIGAGLFVLSGIFLARADSAVPRSSPSSWPTPALDSRTPSSSLARWRFRWRRWGAPA
ncbi:MAG: hypothetical protein WA691_07750, partial [Thermoplasmata archaeon]